MTPAEFEARKAERIEAYQRMYEREMAELNICGRPDEYLTAKRAKERQARRPRFWARKH